MRPTKTDKLREARVSHAFILASPGNPISVLDISKVMNEGRRLIDAGADNATLNAAVLAMMRQLSKETA